MIKACKLCGQEKPETEFYLRKDTGTYRLDCKECFRRKTLERYHNPPIREASKARFRRAYQDRREWQRAYNKEYTAKKRDFVDKIKSRPCTDCNKTFPPEAMDFDHLPGSAKKATVSRMVAGSYTLESVAKEIAKCDLVCACCHRIRTSRRRMPSSI